MADVSKVEYGGRTLIDLTNDTVTSETLGEGATAHDAMGNAIVGTAKIGATEEWIFTLENGSTVTKAVFVE